MRGRDKPWYTLSFPDVLAGKQHRFSSLDEITFRAYDLKDLVSAGSKRRSASLFPKVE